MIQLQANMSTRHNIVNKTYVIFIRRRGHQTSLKYRRDRSSGSWRQRPRTNLRRSHGERRRPSGSKSRDEAARNLALGTIGTKDAVWGKRDSTSREAPGGVKLGVSWLFFMIESGLLSWHINRSISCNEDHLHSGVSVHVSPSPAVTLTNSRCGCCEHFNPAGPSN